MQKIKILATGGTFDKHYDPIKGELTFANSHLYQIASDARLNYEVQIESVSAIDSLFMTDEIRETIAQRCFNSDAKHIVIVHGTDTMVETAKIVAKKCKDLDKTIVLTGAMVPFALEHSDALFNLGFAICSTLCKEKGVYISMGGTIFDYDKVVKNKEKGKFEEINE